MESTRQKGASPPVPAPSLKTVLFWAGLLLVTGLLMAGLGEIILRVVAPQPLIPVIAWTDEHTDKRIRPHLDARMSLPRVFDYRIVTDEHGYRIPEEEEIPCAGPVVAILGDSFGFGVGVAEADSFGGLLRRRLAPDACVVIAAVPGSGLTQQAAVYEREIAALHPAVVILESFANDFGDCERVPIYDVGEDGEAVYVLPGARDPRLRSKPTSDWKPAIVRWLQGNSHLYSLLFVTPPPLFFHDEAPAGAGVAPHPYSAKGVNRYRATLRRLARLCRDAGTTLVVTPIPGEDELMEGENAVLEVVREVAATVPFTVVDPGPALAAANGEKNIWFAEGHFDERGHRAVYEALVDGAGTILSRQALAAEEGAP